MAREATARPLCRSVTTANVGPRIGGSPMAGSPTRVTLVGRYQGRPSAKGSTISWPKRIMIVVAGGLVVLAGSFARVL